MPPHSSHILQPLDVGVFSVLKRLYSAAVKAQIRQRIHHINKLNFLGTIHSIQEQTYTIQNIICGFSHTMLGFCHLIGKKGYPNYVQIITMSPPHFQVALVHQAAPIGVLKRRITHVR